MNSVIEDYKAVADAFKKEQISIEQNESLESILWKANSVGKKDVLAEHLKYNSLKQVARGMRLYMIFGFWPNH